MEEDTFSADARFTDDEGSEVSFSDAGRGSPEALANGDDESEEARLIEAVRSAAEMLAASGLGNTVDIATLQRQRAAMQQGSAGESAQDTGGAFDYGTEFDSAGSSQESDGDVLGSQLESDEDEDEAPLARGLGGAARPARAAGLRSQGGRRVNYSERMDVDSDGGGGGVVSGLVDDDEDSDFTASSSDSEQHVAEYESAMRQAAGFRRRRGRPGARGRGRGKRGRGRPEPEYSAEVQRLLGLGNQRYVEHDLAGALDTFCDIIRLDGTCAAAWNTMALIREEQGEHAAAQQLYTVSAHLNPADNALWERLHAMHLAAAAAAGQDAARRDAELRQALYCAAWVTRNSPRDKTAWGRRLELQERLGQYAAMAKSYRMMLRADPHDVETIRMAAVVYAKRCDDVDTPVRWFSAAFAFYNRQAVEVAEDMVAQADSTGDLGYDAEWAAYFRSNPTKTVPMDELGGYAYGDVNMLAELRMLRGEYEAAVEDIKRGARFVQARGRETQWEGSELSDEHDAEYLLDADGRDVHMGHTLPIELRVKLGQCRLLLGQPQTAQMHLAPLLALDVAAYEDLYTDVAETYAEVGNMEMALATYAPLAARPETNQPALWERMARCYRELGDLGSARAYAEAVVQADPGDVDVRLWLAEVYEQQGAVDLAYAAIQAVEALQEQDRTPAVPASADVQPPTPIELAGDAAPAVVRIERRQPSDATLRRRREADDERKRCLAAMRAADVAFRKLDLLRPALPAAARAYCATAQRLYADWRHTRAFFKADRSRPFVAYRSAVMAALEAAAAAGDLDVRAAAAASGNDDGGHANVQRRLAQMKRRLSRRQAEGDGAAEAPSAASTFRGQPFARWLDMFLQYARCLALDGDAEGALDVLDSVFGSNMFAGQQGERRTVRLVMLAIAISSGVQHRLYDLVRWWCGSQPNKAAAYKILGYAMAGSVEAAMTLTSAGMYKYVRRQLSELNEIYYARGHAVQPPVPAAIDTPLEAGTETVASLSRVRVMGRRDLSRSDVSAVHSVAAHVMLVARTGYSSIMQYTLALALLPQDASIALHLSVAYLQHAVRKGIRDARDMVVRSLAYLQRYAELQYAAEMRARGEQVAQVHMEGELVDVVVTQEIAYNMARVFHFLGMLDLASDHYMRVFSLPVSRLAAAADDAVLCPTMSDLRREAAYNLASICVASGAVVQAQRLLQKYCTI